MPKENKKVKTRELLTEAELSIVSVDEQIDGILGDILSRSEYSETETPKESIQRIIKQYQNLVEAIISDAVKIFEADEDKPKEDEDKKEDEGGGDDPLGLGDLEKELNADTGGGGDEKGGEDKKGDEKGKEEGGDKEVIGEPKEPEKKKDTKPKKINKLNEQVFMSHISKFLTNHVNMLDITSVIVTKIYNILKEQFSYEKARKLIEEIIKANKIDYDLQVFDKDRTDDILAR